MQFGVVLVLANKEVLGAVVRLVSVDVMHNLCSRVALAVIAQTALDCLFGDEDVFVLAPAMTKRDHHVAVPSY